MSLKQKLVVVTLSLLILVVSCGSLYYYVFKWCSPFHLPWEGIICVRLLADGEPRVGKPIRLKVEVARRNQNISKTSVAVKLPPEIELLAGDLEWQVDLNANQKSTRFLTIRVNQPGEWRIEVEAYSPGGYWTSNAIYLLSSPTIGKVSYKQSPNNWIRDTNVGTVLVSPQFDERVSGVLTISPQPSLNQEFKVTYIFKTLIPLNDARIGITFPWRGFEVISVTPAQDWSRVTEGQVEWHGDLKSNQTLSFVVTFKITDVGRGDVNAYSYVQIGEGDTSISISTSSAAYLEVTKYTGRYQMITLP